MASRQEQTSALLRKNWILKKRAGLSFWCELLLPLLLAIVLLLIRSQIDVPVKPDSDILNPSVLFPPSPGFCQITNETGILYIAPDTSAGADFAAYFISQCDTANISNVLVFKDEEALVEAVIEEMTLQRNGEKEWDVYYNEYAVGLIFNAESPDWQYTIRSFNTPDTEGFIDERSFGFWQYFSAKAPLQLLIDEWIQYRERNITPLGFSTLHLPLLGLYPTEATASDVYFAVVFPILSIFGVMAYIQPFLRLVKVMMEEKENRLRIGMAMMGMNDTLVLVTWYITHASVFLLSTVVLCAILYAKVLVSSSLFYTFLYFYLFTLAMISFSFLFTAIFSKTKTATIIGFFIHVGSFFVYTLVTDKSPGVKLMSSLLPGTCFMHGWQIVGYWEASLTGIHTAQVAVMVDNFSFALYLQMIVFDIVFYYLLAWYLSKVLPTEFGTRLPWNFLFLKNYWSPQSSEEAPVEENVPERDEKNFEPLEEELKQRDGVKIRNLVKTFHSETGTFNAVDGLFLEMFEDRVFVLLGHNGAGKTTTISMLTGLIEITSGDALMFGKSVKNNMEEIHQFIGVCPQHDVLWDKMTVKEHLEFYARVKGVPKDQINAVCEQTLKEVGLMDRSSFLTSALSGGMKRMLSVGIAFIGPHSKVIFLDEPTSGMDVNARRRIWEIIKQKKKGKVVVLTTHFMDEADVLGDSIAIMAHGNVLCNGSSLFLKNRYGVGYTLVVSKKHSDRDAVQVSEGIKACVRKHVDSVEVINDIGTELFLRMPFSSTKYFPDLFREFDASAEDLSIENYSISVTTLEEVFLKVGENTAETKEERSRTLSAAKHLQNDTSVSSIASVVELSTRQPVTTFNDRLFLWFVHVRAIMSKNMRTQLRDKLTVFCNLILPTLLLAVGLVATIGTSSIDPDPLTLSLAQYPPFPVRVPFYRMNDSFDSVMASFFDVKGTAFETFELEESSVVHTGHTDAPGVWGLGNTFGDALVEYELTTGIATYGALSVQTVEIPIDENTSFPMQANVILTNISGIHALPTYINALSNALLGVDTTTRINTTYNAFSQLTSQDELVAEYIVSMVPLIFAIIPAGFVIPVVKERETRAKLQQIISGLGISSYWIGNFLFDLGMYSVPAILTLLLIWVSDCYFYAGSDDNDFLAMCLLVLMYCLSNLFSNGNTAKNVLIVLNIFLGYVLAIVSYVLTLFESTKNTAETLQPLFRLIPAYCFSSGIFNMRLNYRPQKDALTDAIALPAIVAMSWEGPVYLGLNLLFTYIAQVPRVEYMYRTFLRNLKNTPTDDTPIKEDEDVLEEKKLLEEGSKEDALIKIKGLRKEYPGRFPVVAVRDLWLSLSEGEVFGFLGVNGAGKTTTLNVLSGDTPPTAGEVILNGMNIIEEASEIRRMIGYCPQLNALFPLLTGREHLTFYARIKGVDEKNIQAVVTGILHYLSLDEYGDRMAGTYSGGNKRKLSAAISLIGNPRIVFLDEISTGVDPISRRFMWRFINETKKGRSAILTTHSLEECEALCNRIGIMVDGSLRCLGTPHHLKRRFGQGFQMEMLVPKDEAENVFKFVKETFKNSQLLEHFDGLCKFHLESDPECPLPRIFEIIEENKEQLKCKEYSVSHTTLEQVFLYFAKKLDQA